MWTPVEPWKISKNSMNFGGFWGNFKDISSILHQCKGMGSRSSKGGVHESRNIKIAQNAFKQTKTIIESPLYKSSCRIIACRVNTVTPYRGSQTPQNHPLTGVKSEKFPKIAPPAPPPELYKEDQGRRSRPAGVLLGSPIVVRNMRG